ncbi:MAG TPA: DEAD/DEAH box helicase, partial [Kribbella sp.]
MTQHHQFDSESADGRIKKPRHKKHQNQSYGERLAADPTYDAPREAPRDDRRPVKGYRSEQPRTDRGQRSTDRNSQGDRPSYRRDDRAQDNRARFDRDDRTPNRRDDKPQYNRDSRTSYNRDDRGSYNRDDRPQYNRDDKPQYGRDNRSYNQGDRPRYNRDDKPQYNRDSRTSYNRDDRPQYNRDDRGSYNRDEKPQYSRDNRSYNQGDRPRYNRDDKPQYSRDNRTPYNRDEKPRFDRDDRARAQSVRNEEPVDLGTVAEDNQFAALGLAPRLVQRLARDGITTPFPIQAATIPDALAGKDVLGRGQTGSGKTLGFGLPTLMRLAGGHTESRRPRGMILVPTRELAMQVHDALEPLAHVMNVSLKLIAGGLPYPKQIDALRRGVDLLIATPGRLIDLCEQGAADLGAVEVAVLDEADHMCDMGFMPAVTTLLDMTPPEGQRLLFSATLDNDVDKIVKTYLKDPVQHSTESGQASVSTMEHHLLVIE